MNKEFIPYEQALELKELGFDEPCLAHLIGFGDGSKENGRYKINQQQVFYPNDYTSSDDKAEELGLHPFGMCGVPLYRQAFRWFREKHNLHAWIINAEDNHNVFKPFFRGANIHDQHLVDFYKTYEEAELACLNKLIEIVKNK
jgi:hypothetical protein